MRFCFVLVFAVGLVISAAEQGLAIEPANKFALVVGNAKYPDSDLTLSEIVNDSQDIADELKRNNFDVESGINLTGAAMRAALDRFYGKIKPGSVAVIFFDGFGIQSARQTYLIPVDAQIWTEPDVQRDGFGLEAILSEMNARGALVKIALLDASRRNPFERRFRSYSAGLTPVLAPANSLVMYSAALGSVINDVGITHGLFVREFLRETRVPGIAAEQALTNTKRGVAHASRGEQVPWFSSSMAVDFSFTSNPDLRKDTDGVRKDPDELRKDTDSARKKDDREECISAAPAVSPSLNELAKDPVINDLNRRISVNRNDKVAYYKRGQVYASKGAFSLAIKDFDEVIGSSPKDVEAHNNRCWANAAGGDLQLGLKDCNEALRLRPGFADALDSRGLIYLKLGRNADAIADYSAALETNPRQVSSLFGRGIAKKRSKVDGAADLSLAKSLDPDIAKEFAKYDVSECSR
jgi:caspase domain-containing protein/tetratricopeptide repeat protein